MTVSKLICLLTEMGLIKTIYMYVERQATFLRSSVLHVLPPKSFGAHNLT